MASTLVHASVGRTGLGNMLFSWARAEVFSQRFRVPMLRPQWTQPKLGPLLRGETDLRYYAGLFDDREYVRGSRRLLALLRRRRVDGATIGINGDPASLPSSCDGALVVFRGWQGWFRDDLHPHRELVRRRLETILTDRVRREIDSFPGPIEIAIHVRRGDMRNLVPPGHEMPEDNVVESEYYYLSVLRAIRRVVGRCVPAWVFTDAREGELESLRREDEVRFGGRRSSIADMLSMSRASFLIASSASSFSAWASYLGAVPTVWHRGRVQRLFPDRPELSIESDPHGDIGDQGRAHAIERFGPPRSGAST